MLRKIGLFGLLGMLLFFSGSHADAQKGSAPSVRFVALKFFEGPWETPPLGARVYPSEFSRSTARYIYSEIEIENLEDFGPNTVTARFRYYRSDGSLFSDVDMTHTIPEEEYEYFLWKGTGWSDPGNWPADRYRVEVSIDGTYVGEGYFTVTGSASGKTSPKVEFVGVKFFESAFNVPAIGDRVYSTTFDRARARYIYPELEVRNLRQGTGPNTVLVRFRFFKPDGTLFSDVDMTHTIPSEYEKYLLWKGTGWDEAGNWPTGQYRVEISIDGTYLGEGYFTVTGSAPSKNSGRTVEFVELKFFESGYEPPAVGQRTYSTTFDRASARYIQSEISLRNLLKGERPNPVTAKLRYYSPDGSLFCEIELKHTIPSEYYDYLLWKGWGWAEAGNWTPGTYRVEAYIDGQYLGENSFTITGRTEPRKGGDGDKKKS